MIPLLWSWHDEWLILPAVRAWVGRAATCAAWLAGAAACTAVAEIVLAPCIPPLALLCGMLSQATLGLFFYFLPPLMLWCHIVLLGLRGFWVTRYLLLFCLFLTAVHAVCHVYSLFSDSPLLPQHGLLAIIVPLLLHLSTGANWGNMAAAPRLLKIQALAAPLVWLLAYGTDVPETLPAAVLFKVLLCLCMWIPLRRLARYAPLIVSLPPQESSGEDESHNATDK